MVHRDFVRRALPVAAIGVAAAIAAAGAASAHHSFAMFDNGKEVVLDGTVKQFQWTNPHSWIQLNVTENGQVVEYSIEGRSPNILARLGWSPESLKPGDRVKVRVHPLKDGSKGGSFLGAVFADGRVLKNNG